MILSITCPSRLGHLISLLYIVSVVSSANAYTIFSEKDGQEDSFVTHLLDGHQMLLDASLQFLTSYFIYM